VLAGFMNLPQDGRGSYALSSDASGFFNFSLQTSANFVGETGSPQVDSSPQPM